VRRVAVIGISCSGKSTLARALSERLDVPHIELDALNHEAGWTEVSAEVLRARVRAALESAADGWVVDGNYFGKLADLVLEQTDTVVLLDLPLRVAVRRAVTRTASRLLRRTELWNGNRERLRNVFSRNSIPLWVLRGHRTFGPKWDERLRAHPQLRVIRLTSPRAVSAWLQSIQATATMSGSSNASERQKTPPLSDT
jgi:adenylate kinase family enzyme